MEFQTTLDTLSRRLTIRGKRLWQSLSSNPPRTAYHGLAVVEGTTACVLFSTDPILAALAVISAFFTLILARHTGAHPQL